MYARVIACILPVVVLVFAPRATNAVESAEDKDLASALAIRQDRVKAMMSVLEEKLIRLASDLQATEPEQAVRLVETLHAANEQRIEHRMEMVARLLNQLDLDLALAGQEKIVRDLQDLIATFEDEQDSFESYTDLARRLDRWGKKIQKLIKQEARDKSKVHPLSDPEESTRDLGQQITQLRELIKGQRYLKQQTRATRAMGIHGLGKLAKVQRDLRQKTGELSRDVSFGQSDQASDEQDISDGERFNKRDASSEADSVLHEQRAPQALRNTERQQREAERNLDKAKGKAAGQNQAHALEHMEHALRELHKEWDRLAIPPAEQLESMAKAEDNRAECTGELAKEMVAAAGDLPKSRANGEEGAELCGGSGLGQEHVQQAEQAMRRAASHMRQNDAAQAAHHQQSAIDQLRTALELVKHRLAQLRQAIQADMLMALEARFSRMLARQKPLTAATLQLDLDRSQRSRTRAERLLCSTISREERQLSQMAGHSLEMIIEDGSTVVLPRIVQAMHDDLLTIAALMDRRQTDRFTQSLQAEIEQTLEKLIVVFDQALEQQQAQAAQDGLVKSGGSPHQQPLVPESAELKLLQNAQLQINRQTVSFDGVRRDGDGDLDPVMTRTIQRMSQEQQYLAGLAEEMIKGRMSQFEEVE